MADILQWARVQTGFLSRFTPTFRRLRDMGDGTHAPTVTIVPYTAPDGHTRVHQGVLFSASYMFTGLTDNSTASILLTTPADDWPHLVVEPSLDGSCDIELFEAPTFTSGTAVAVVNHNRTVATAFGGTVVHSPTVTQAGTSLIAVHMPGGTGPHASGVRNGFEFEWVLKESTSYLLRLTNRSGQSRRGGLALHFYSAPRIPPQGE